MCWSASLCQKESIHWLHLQGSEWKNLMTLRVPVLALKVASRIAIYSSKHSKTLWRPVICRGKCGMELEVLCVLPPPSPTSEQMLWVNQAAVRAGRLDSLWDREKEAWLEGASQATGRPPGPRAGPDPTVFQHLEEMKNSSRRETETERQELRRREGNKVGKGE